MFMAMKWEKNIFVFVWIFTFDFFLLDWRSSGESIISCWWKFLIIHWMWKRLQRKQCLMQTFFGFKVMNSKIVFLERETIQRYHSTTSEKWQNQFYMNRFRFHRTVLQPRHDDNGQTISTLTLSAHKSVWVCFFFCCCSTCVNELIRSSLRWNFHCLVSHWIS